MIIVFLGARLFYIIQEWEYFKNSPLEIFSLHEGGIIFYGGLICAFPCIFFMISKRGYYFFDFANFMIPFIPFAHGLGRIGCFFNGCCYGYCSLLGFLLPIQLVESVANFILAYILFFIRARLLCLNKILLPLYLLVYSFIRFVLEYYRQDSVYSLLGFRLSQWISLFIFFIGLLLLLVLRKKR